MTKLSIIVPCYNCGGTLETAVDSIFRQDPGVPFDVTMVDDGSLDNTYQVMEMLAGRYPAIRLVRHDSNQGGGAARNTAVANSEGDLIFNVDADDVLGPDLLGRLTRFWATQRCDAVGISRSIKFRGTDLNNVAYVTEFAGPGERVPFESLLDGSACSLTSMFMMTRKAFDLVGGYPTSHGFDNQGMAFRFLANGLTAYTCPEAIYYHRVEFGDSWYVRERKAGRAEWNWLHVLDEFIYLFNPEAQRRILEARLFSPPGERAAPSLLSVLRASPDFYAANYRALIRLGWRGAARCFRSTRNCVERYWLGSDSLRRSKYAEALAHYALALELGFDYQIIYYRILEASFRLSRNGTATAAGLGDLIRYCQPVPEHPLTLAQRIFHGLLESKRFRSIAIWGKAGRDFIGRRRSHA